MTDAPKKTIRWIPGDTVVRLIDISDTRPVTIIMLCGWLFLGWWNFFKEGTIPAGSQPSPFTSAIWVPFGLWSMGLVLFCALNAWVFFGSIRFSVSAEKLIIRNCLDGQPIFTYPPIDLSTIAKVSVEEQVHRVRGRTVHSWPVLAHAGDGEIHPVAIFYSESAANRLVDNLLNIEH